MARVRPALVAACLVVALTSTATAAATTAAAPPTPTTSVAARAPIPPSDWAFRPFDPDFAAGTTVTFPFGSLTLGDARTFPALSATTGVDLSYILVRIHGGATAPAHVHPRGAELAFVLRGAVRLAWTDEVAPSGGAGRVVANGLPARGIGVVPRGAVHSVHCVAEGGCVVLAVFNAGDPGTSFLASSLCALGGDHVVGALGNNMSVADAATFCKGGVL